MLTAAARSTWPGAVGGLLTEPFTLGAVVGPGREAVGTTGFPTVGLAPIGGGFGLAATGGGGLEPIELGGRETAGEPLLLEAAFFQGAADPSLAAIPGNTETGFADGLATGRVISTLGSPGAFLGGGAGTRGAGSAFGTSSR